MRLNIHIDESGTDDMGEGSHLVAMVLHEHSDDIDSHIARYELELELSGLPDVPFHGVKLLHGHADYEGVDPDDRLFSPQIGRSVCVKNRFCHK